MSIIFYLILISLGLGAIGLAAFLWTLKSGQYDDLDGAAERILFDDAEDRPADASEDAPDRDEHSEDAPHRDEP